MPEPASPYDDLDRANADAARGGPGEGEAGALRVLARGLLRRCPHCGSGRLFERWLRIRERCPGCGLRLEREEGGFLGAMTINYHLAVFGPSAEGPERARDGPSP